MSSFSFQDWCQSNWSETAIGKAALCNFKATNTTAACFSSSSGNAAVKEIQQCDQDKSFFRVLLLVVFLVFNLASLLASLRLNRILNYVELYKISKIFLGCQTQPILHCAVQSFNSIESDTKEHIELFDEIFGDGKDLSDFINRPNSR